MQFGACLLVQLFFVSHLGCERGVVREGRPIWGEGSLCTLSPAFPLSVTSGIF